MKISSVGAYYSPNTNNINGNSSQRHRISDSINNGTGGQMPIANSVSFGFNIAKMFSTFMISLLGFSGCVEKDGAKLADEMGIRLWAKNGTVLVNIPKSIAVGNIKYYNREGGQKVPCEIFVVEDILGRRRYYAKAEQEYYVLKKPVKTEGTTTQYFSRGGDSQCVVVRKKGGVDNGPFLTYEQMIEVTEQFAGASPFWDSFISPKIIKSAEEKVDATLHAGAATAGAHNLVLDMDGKMVKVSNN